MEPTAPATIASLTALGVAGFTLTCRASGCHQRGRIAFADLGLPDSTPFPDIPRLKRFTCSHCGVQATDVFPDWTTHRAYGAGGGV